MMLRLSLLVSGHLTEDRLSIEQVQTVVNTVFFNRFIHRFLSDHRICMSFLLVRGMMYYRQALDLQCFLEYAGDKG